MEPSTLTTQENLELEQYEAVIDRDLKAFMRVGNALLSIRGERLYRDRYGTWEEYCQKRFDFTIERARLLMRGAEVVKTISETPTMVGVLPTSERQVRPLTRLEPEQQQEAWAQVVEENPDGKITGAKVQAVIDRIHPTMQVTQEEMDEIDQEEERYCSSCKHYSSGSGTDDGWCNDCHRIVPWDDPDPWCGLEDWETEEEEQEPQFYTITKASQAVAVTIFSSESEEYYTPSQYVEAAREVMGGIDLDPASNERAQEWINAGTFYTAGDDGLSEPWHGRVWLNPPYGTDKGKSNQGTWAQRLIEEYQAGNVTEGILLVKAALGYNWFESLWIDWPVCFARERISFIKADGSSDGQSKQGTAFFYLGPNVARFAEVFRFFGRVIMPEGDQ